MLTRVLEEIYKKYNNKLKTNLKNNFKNNINKVTNFIIKLIFYNGNNYVNKIINILQIMFKYFTYIRPNRKFRRICIIPSNKWYRNKEDIT